jgi:hypothetical protein
MGIPERISVIEVEIVMTGKGLTSTADNPKEKKLIKRHNNFARKIPLNLKSKFIMRRCLI